jgi:beta-lactam-binding protein with PASTA domain
MNSPAVRTLVFLALAAAAARPAATDDPPTPLAMVPAVSGNYWSVAQDLIRAAGLHPRVRSEGLTSGSTIGPSNTFSFVTRQSPSPGQFVAPGTWVMCWVEARGHVRHWDYRTVPDVVGMTLSRAAERVRSTDLRVTSQMEQGGEGPLVVRMQTPPPGFHTVVDAHVHLLARHERPATGPSVARVGALVPSLIGRNRSDADRSLTAVGLRANWLGDPRGGVVYQQSPGGGERIPPGSPVHVWLRPAPAVTQTIVPNVVGRTETEANAMLRAARLVPARAAGPAGGTVVRQQPASGIRVPGDSVVNLTLAIRDSASEVVVPNVVGRSVAEAGAMLGTAGLRARRLGAGRGPVLRQSPRAGSRLPRGAEVALAFGK